MAFLRCAMSPDEAWQGYKTIYLTAVGYPLAATAIDYDKLQSVQQKITNVVLPRIGYNRHMPHAVIYAPNHLGGIGRRNLAVKQGIALINYIIGQLRFNQTDAKTIHILFESYSIQVGSVENPLQDNRAFPYVHAPWLECTRQFLRITESKISIPHLRTPVKIRIYNQEVMPLAMQYTSKTKQLQQINACRLYLQVTTMAEISSQNGTHLIDYAMTGTTDNDGRPMLWTISTSKLQWPIQQRPKKRSW